MFTIFHVHNILRILGVLENDAQEHVHHCQQSTRKLREMSETGM